MAKPKLPPARTYKEMSRNLSRWEHARELEPETSFERLTRQRRCDNNGLHPALKGHQRRLPQVEARLAECVKAARLRMAVVAAGLHGKSVLEISLKFGVWQSQIVRWFRLFRACEIEAFEAMNVGRRRRTNYRIIEAMRRAFRWRRKVRVDDALEWLSQHGENVSRDTAWRYLTRRA